MRPRTLPLVTALGALVLSTLAFVAAASAGDPSGVDENGRAVHVVCPDGYGGATVPVGPGTTPAPGDCESLADALTAASDNGMTDDLILLRPGYYCPVDLPQTGVGRLYLQGVPTAAYGSAPGEVAAPTRSVVEGVTFAPYAAEDCAGIYGGDVIRMGPSGSFVFLENLAVDGSDDPTFVPGTSSFATTGIELAGAAAFVRDVVVQHAATGLTIAGGEVSHSAFVQNQYVGVQTAPNRPTWLQDVLIADTRTADGGHGTGYYDGTQTQFAQNADTLRNVTITGNRVGIGRPPSTYDTYAHVRNSLVAGNDTDCDYAYAGGDGGSDHNAVGSSCYALSVSEHASTTDGSAIADVDHVDGFEPYADPGATDPEGDPATCSPTDQLERARTGCYVGAISPIVEVPVGPAPPISDLVSFPPTIDLGDATAANVYLSNLRDGLVTVRDVEATAGYAVTRDSCSLGALPRTWITGQAAGGSAPQSSCSIVVTVASAGPMSGTLSITTNKGVLTIQLSAGGAGGPTGSTDPTPTGTGTQPPATGTPSSSAPPQAKPAKPAKPRTVRATPKRKAATVHWKPATGATSYLVQVKVHGRWATTATTTATTATVKHLRSGKRVKLRVVAVNAAGRTPSAAVTVRPR